ncbi:MAG: response regulator transcription factor [Flavobacteriales bacterium]|nr:response regulator transcription factor [Flavobacteriales bacterium]
MRAANHRIPVALIDDHTLLRNMLATMIGNMPAYEVVMDASNGAEFVKSLEASNKRVAVVVVDLHMPVMDGYQTITWLRNNRPGTRALALTFERSPEAMERAMRAGACGFVLKDAPYKEFKKALDQVAMVGHYQNNIEFTDEELGLERNVPEGVDLLSEREIEFIRLSCDTRELTYENIGEVMDVHRRTLDGYRNSVFAKLNVKTRAGLVFAAMKYGIVERR